MRRAFIFPGQGSQAVGMGKPLAEAFSIARETFEEIDEALKQPLSRLMFEGPPEELALTENAQPALMAVSMAVARVLEQQGGIRVAENARYVAGHSLGEYSALAAAGSLELGTVARLLRLRGRAMQSAVPLGQGAMAAILGLEFDAVAAVAAEAAAGEVCSPANDNAPGQVVLSGDATAVNRAIALAKAQGAKAVLLNVSAPFHCALLAPAADAMAEALAGVTVGTPAVPLITNVTAVAETVPERIRSLLVDQVTGMVRWRESMLYMKENGVEQLVEIGFGKVLSTMARRIDKDLSGVAVGTPADVEAFLKAV